LGHKQNRSNTLGGLAQSMHIKARFNFYGSSFLPKDEEAWGNRGVIFLTLEKVLHQVL
jgi:hypothetical protein